MQVVIPLAGLGTRLRPHTHTKPKPLVTVAGKPVLGHIIDMLDGLRFEEIIFIVGYLGEQIEQYVTDTYDFPARYVEQKELKGQAHAIRLTRDFVKGPVLIVFGDGIIETDLMGLLDLDSDGVIYVKEVDDPRRFGVVTLKDGFITRFVEKPREPLSNLAVIGIYFIKDHQLLFECIEQLIEQNIQTKGEFYLADALQLMVAQGAEFEVRTADVWEDCGTPESLLQTNRYLLRKTVTDGRNTDNSIIIPPVSIADTASVVNSIVGPYVCIGENSTIVASVVGPYVSIANDNEISSSIVKDSIINQGSRIEEAMLSNSLIGENARVKGTFERLNVGDWSQVDSSLSVLAS